MRVQKRVRKENRRIGTVIRRAVGAFLHETDHLNGRLFINHISALKRDLIKRRIRKMAKAGEW